VLFALTVSAYAQTATMSGFVVDEENGETLLLANVVIRELGLGTATNTAGFYTISEIPPGRHEVTVSYLGYATRILDLEFEPDEHKRLDIELSPESLTSEEIVVTGDREAEEEVRRIGVAQITTAQVREVPALLEADVFRSLQLLPGVKAASDYSSGLYVRGGTPDQTLILLDRTTVYNPSHFFGFFSTFNPDAIKDVRLYKGGYPAEYGGRLGSVLDIYNKDGNRNRVQGGVTLGLLASRVNVEGPYSKGSWMVAARRTTLEPLLAIMRSQDVEGAPESFWFLDFNAKLNYDAGLNDKLSVSFYSGRDDLAIEAVDDLELEIQYGNRTLSGNWVHLFSDQLFSDFTLTTSRYFSEPKASIASTPFERDNTVVDHSVKGDFEYIPSGRSTSKAGFWAGLFTMEIRDKFDDIVTLDERIHAQYASAYFQQTYRPNPLWMLQGGVRLNYFSEGDFVRAEPRFAVEYKFNPKVTFQVGGGRYYQFLTLITSELFSGFDIWLTADDGVIPAYGDQIVGGVKTVLGQYNVDVEAYFRNMQSLFELDPFLPDAAGLDYSDLFHFGEGYAYGTEISVQKTVGRLNGFAGYTLGFTRRKFPNVNSGEFYAPKYDRTHDLNITLNYLMGKGWRFTSIFTYATGQTYTEPLAQYKVVDNPFTSADFDVLVSPFNAARLPAYHRLDVGFSKVGTFFGIGDYELQLQALNTYFRRNIWFYFYEFERDGSVTREEVPQIPILIPNISFTVRF
jgi:hypothetical protein